MWGLPLVLAIWFGQVHVPLSEGGAPLALTVTYSDGRVLPRILTPRGGSWAPSFPHRPDAPTRDGLAVSGLKVDHHIEAGTVVVTVSLTYGRPVKHTTEVAVVRLSERQRIEVRELTAFGVDPITLALEPAVPTSVVVPATTSASAMLDVKVDLLSADLPLYEVTFHNTSPMPIAAIAYHAYRGEASVLSGTRSHPRNFPVLDAGAKLQFTTQAASNSGAQGFDRFEVTGVLWWDGSVEGDASLEARQRALAIGTANQLKRVVAVLRENQMASLAEVRSAVERLPVKLSANEMKALVGADGGDRHLALVEAGQSYVRTAVLDELKVYMGAPSPNGNVPAAWAEEVLIRYTGWLRRVTRR